MLVPMPPHPDMPAGYERDAEAIATYQAYVHRAERRRAAARKAVLAARFLAPWPPTVAQHTIPEALRGH